MHGCNHHRPFMREPINLWRKKTRIAHHVRQDDKRFKLHGVLLAIIEPFAKFSRAELTLIVPNLKKIFAQHMRCERAIK